MAKQAEWRRVETTVSDGPGQERTEASYVFGAEIDGVFVAAVTKSAGYIDHLVERGQEQQQAEQDAAGDTSKASGSGGGAA